jgi:co-chaperonin GroES (HSP10)
MAIQPLKDFLLLKPVEASQVSSGLYVPEDSTAKIQKGEVVAIGPNFAMSESYGMPYKVGDIVLYSIYGANELREDRQKLFLVPDKEVWAKVT